MKKLIVLLLLIPAPCFTQEYHVDFTKPQVLDGIKEITDSLIYLNESLQVIRYYVLAGEGYEIEPVMADINKEVTSHYLTLLVIHTIVGAAKVQDPDIDKAMEYAFGLLKSVSYSYRNVQQDYLERVKNKAQTGDFLNMIAKLFLPESWLKVLEMFSSN